MARLEQSGGAGTFLWIGDGGRPLYGVVEHFVRWRWPELRTSVERRDRLCQWRLYTLDCQLTAWPLAHVWPPAADHKARALVGPATASRWLGHASPARYACLVYATL